MLSAVNSKLEVSGCPRCVFTIFCHCCRHWTSEVGMRKVTELYKMYRELPVFQVLILFLQMCLKCWFRPCLTRWKSSAMKTTLVVKIQPYLLILRLLSSTLLTGWVNNAVTAMNVVKSVRIGCAHSVNVLLEVCVLG